MKPAWDQLGKDYAKSKDVVIADVDCTVHQQLCQTNGVQGYPSIKYYIAGSSNDYRGGRDLASLKQHVEQKMGPPPPPCNVKKQDDTCSKREMKFIKTITADNIDEETDKLKQKRKDKMKKKKGKKYIGQKWDEKRLDLLKQLKKNPSSLSSGEHDEL